MEHSSGVKNSSLWAMCIAIYPGQYYDEDTGLHYNWNRYYDPEIGRYLRVDPILSSFLYEGSFHFFVPKLKDNPNKMHSYKYAFNNPIIWTDTKGLAPNGCGTAGWKGKLVPENPFWLANFQPACNGHDTCYEGCNANKAECDKIFWNDMVWACVMRWGWANPMQKQPPQDEIAQRSCETVAKGYYLAVDKLGQSAFEAAQKENEDKCCEDK